MKQAFQVSTSEQDLAQQRAGLFLGRFMLIAAVIGLVAGFLAIDALPEEGFEMSPHLAITWAAVVGLLLVSWRYDPIKSSISTILINGFF